MNRPKNTEELYEKLIEYLKYRHFIYRYGSPEIMDIIELTDKGNARNFLRNRYSSSGNGYVLSYTKARSATDVWRLYVRERSA